LIGHGNSSLVVISINRFMRRMSTSRRADFGLHTQIGNAFVSLFRRRILRCILMFHPFRLAAAR
jgi:hypothetical protein